MFSNFYPGNVEAFILIVIFGVMSEEKPHKYCHIGMPGTNKCKCCDDNFTYETRDRGLVYTNHELSEVEMIEMKLTKYIFGNERKMKGL